MTDWKNKLLAYLHDPPSKVLDIASHGEQSRAAMSRAGFTEEECKQYNRPADHTAAAADRFPFPAPRASGMRCHFDGVRNGFHHPLGGGELRFHAELRDVKAIEGEGAIQPALARMPEEWSEDLKWRARYFAHWRLWPQFAAENDYRYAFLPADTRIPDHTIWNHMQVVSALAGCAESDSRDAAIRPAFLKLQIGPVQEFIAQARSIRDQWSGSYLLSWLMAAGLKALSAEVGPDAVIYPSLRGQPLFDLHWKKELWDRVFIGKEPVWKSFEHEDQDLLTPNLPNVFLALVPAKGADQVAKKVEQAIRDEFARIAEVCWKSCEAAGLTGEEGGLFPGRSRKERFDRHIGRFLSIAWQVTPWPEKIKELKTLVADLPFAATDPGAEDQPSLAERVERVIAAATQAMPADHRDGRYYTDREKKEELNNVGVAWALISALNGWQLDAVRQVRDFEAWNTGGWSGGTVNNKDSLTGKEEAVAGGRNWLELCEKLAGRSKDSTFDRDHGALASRFKHEDWLGAITLIKRVWDLAYLKPEPDWGFSPLKMPNTYGLARHKPFSNDEGHGEDREEGENYFAVLAFDGDRIGQWVAGDRCPPLRDQLAVYTDGSGQPQGALEYFERDSDPDRKGHSLRRRFEPLLQTRRPVSPGYHLQFSEALTNFALKCARPVVEAYDGRLVYSGGDDVVALLPADVALPCAEALRLTFQGDPGVAKFLRSTVPSNDGGRHYHQRMALQGKLLVPMEGTNGEGRGFLCRFDKGDQGGKPIPFVVPGTNASASVGVAIAHSKSPLQDVIRAAQAAEKRAKGTYGRAALAVTLMKRSGETIEWGCQWRSAGLELYRGLIESLREGELSAKFPYRVVELLEPYLLRSTPLVEEDGTLRATADFDTAETIEIEFGHAVSQQSQVSGKAGDELTRTLAEGLNTFLTRTRERLQETEGSEPADERELNDALLNAVIGLCQTVAFARRNPFSANGSTDSTQETL